MRVGIIAKTDDEKAIDLSRELLNYLKRFDDISNIVVEKELSKKLDIDGIFLGDMNIDIAITIGGDGTLLRTLQHCDAKIFGINVGKLGFLTEGKTQNMASDIDKIIKGEYIIEKRTKLKTVLNNKKLVDSVNEVVIHTGHIAKIQEYRILVDNDIIGDIRTDGIIIATSTGSTSYAMSAGGPILDPRVDGFIIVPIAPFKLSARPIVVPVNSRITIEILEEKPNSILVLDGQYEKEVFKDDMLYFTVSEKTANFIRFKSNFYERFNKKIAHAK